MTVLAAGQRIADRYQLDRRIAVGGMGEVWEASDTRLGRSVAVKVLRPELSGDSEFLHRFQVEARTVASLDHTGIAVVHDYGEDDGPSGQRTAYLVMELVRGEPLSTLIARGPIDVDETLRIIEDAAWALQAAHERGYVHRDVKPGNILVRTDGLIKLTDFGIAKAADAVPVTRTGMVMGTAHYIAPEQASGAEAGPAGDVYSLGIVGYECLAGHRPFRAESAVAVAMMQVRDAPPPLPDTVPLLARELIESVLVKDPALRYATGGEFAAAVAAVRRGEAAPEPASVSGVTPVVSPPLARSGISLATPPPAPAVASPRTTGTGRAEPEALAARPARSAEAEPKRPAREPAGRRRITKRRSDPPVRPRAPALPSTEQLRVVPATGPNRSLLLVLFVVLTVAALVVGTLVLLGEGFLASAEPTTAGAPGGSVSSREGGPAAPAVWPVGTIAMGAGPVNPRTRRSGARVPTTRHRSYRPGMMSASLESTRNRQR